MDFPKRIGYNENTSSERGSQESAPAIRLRNEEYHEHRDDTVDESVFPITEKEGEMRAQVREQEKRHLVRSFEHALKSHHRRSRDPMIDGGRAGTVPNAHPAAESEYGQECFTENVSYQKAHEEHRTSRQDKDSPNLPETDIPESRYLPEEQENDEKFRVIAESIDDSDE